MRFEVLRNSRPIGERVLRFQGAPDPGFKVGIDIDLAIRFGPFTLHEYQHRNRTEWRSGRLMELRSETNDDGAAHRLHVFAEGDALRIEPAGGAPFRVSPNALPSTYWMAATVDQVSLLNSQTGEMLDITVRRVGRDTVAGPDGPIPATYYRMAGDLDADLWYDAAGVLVGLAFDARGSRVDYRLVERAGSIPAYADWSAMNTRK